MTAAHQQGTGSPSLGGAWPFAALALQVLEYSALQDALAIGGLRELEDFLITDCFYTGKLAAGRFAGHRCFVAPRLGAQSRAGVACGAGVHHGVLASAVDAWLPAHHGAPAPAMAGILQGKLDQQQRCLQVHGCISRDVRPEDVASLATGLATW
jgi:hypothetical protein